ncbi:phenylacetate--CoA ligase family protein [Desulfovibrio psychrotolerans]|uniref:Phenylacetate-coenzyme A ligase n=1 Tax=Desulfovibrio psychrotolerans TaxID=415242 RepID=A0A7J0BTA1_9BACT|nr:phenylacetate--CoA ligase [Desulfovibrio psychrotolerans]GFM36946.1 phenylacetate-coenzyme A ligase [Desulfovibrio psychrotolerans]
MECFDRAEFWSREEIERAQLVRLRNVVGQAMRSPFYAKRLKEAGIAPETLKSLDDVRRIPCTTKDDLRSQYPDGLNTLPQCEMVRMHASSGTTGSPTVIHYTQNDLNLWADLMARCMHMVGVRREDVFQNITGYGLFTGGLGLHYGAERLGCLTIPAGPGNTTRQLKIMRDFRTTVAHIIPSYALYFGAALRDSGEDAKNLALRIALIGAEPHTEETRKRIEELLDVKAYNSYGLSEMNGPGVAFECVQQAGMHVWEDAFIAEIVDPDTLEPVAEGEVGELVMTTLCRQGMPILRYRTKDLTRFIPGECACGRHHRRIDRILGRADDMLIIKGVNIYPMQVEQILMSFPEVGENYQIVLERENYLDQIRVKVEIKEEHFVEDMRVLRDLQKRITNKLRDEVLITPRVDLVQNNGLPKAEGKAQRVVDSRES